MSGTLLALYPLLGYVYRMELLATISVTSGYLHAHIVKLNCNILLLAGDYTSADTVNKSIQA